MKLVSISGSPAGLSLVQFTKDSFLAVGEKDGDLSVSVLTYDSRSADVSFGRRLWKQFVKDELGVYTIVSVRTAVRGFQKWLHRVHGRKY